jgi:hypothetical protein
MRARALITTGVAAAALALAAAFHYGFEKEARWVETGYGPEARSNPYLAAGRLFESLGAEVETARGGAELRLPPAGGTLVVPASRESLELRAPELIEWVRSGGHLIVAVAEAAGDEEAVDAQDKLLAPLDVRTVPAPEQAALPAVAWPGRRSTLSASLAGNMLLREGARRAAWRITAGEDAMVLRFHEGRGSLTVLASAAFLRNDLIGEGDNALAAWLLVSAAGERRPVTIVVSDEAPGLLALLWRSRPAALLGACCFVGAFVWLGASRLGPVLPAGDPPRRSLREHVEATGRFLWRTRQAGALLEVVWASLELQLLRRHPGWYRLPRGELAQRVGTHLPDGVRPDRVRGPRVAEKQFVEAVASMERTRRSL